MEKCCEIKVSEMENGLRIDITGEGVKERCRGAVESCCSAEGLKKCFQSCCTPDKNEASCC